VKKHLKEKKVHLLALMVNYWLKARCLLKEKVLQVARKEKL
jgi:DNA polymerase sigma